MSGMENIDRLLTDHLDLWTSAIARKSAAGRGRSKKFRLYGINKLRALILDLAVRGKLVAQNPEDEPATELLKRIKIAKKQLVAENKIRQPREFADGNDAKAAFSIPESWMWVRLDTVGAIVGVGTPSANNPGNFVEPGSGFPWLTPADLGGYTDLYITRGSRDLSEEGLLNSSATVLPKDTVLFTSRAPIGYVAISSNPIATNQGFKSVVPYISGSSQYIALALRAFAHEINEKAPSTTFKEVSGKIVAAVPFPLPPLSEQHRIVAKVDELMALCDRLETGIYEAIEAHHLLVAELLATLTASRDAGELADSWARIEAHFDTLFVTEDSVDQLKQTILQLAIMGRLVPQDPEDEPAIELLERIAVERSKISSQLKTRKSDYTGVPKNYEKPFDLPRGWEWALLIDIGLTQTGGTPRTFGSGFSGGQVPFVGPGQITPDGEIKSPEKYLNESGVAESAEALSGDILMVCIGGSIGKAAIVSERIAFNQQINSVRPILVDGRYLLHVLNGVLFQRAILDRATGSATPIINRTKWETIVLPIPPQIEQKRIAAKIDELNALCDKLRLSLLQGSEIQTYLSDAIVKNAVG